MTVDNIIDLNGVKDRLDGDRDFFNELVGILVDDYKSYFERIQTGIRSQDPKAIQEASHALKSALGNLGSVRARAAAYALEMAGKGGDLNGVDLKVLELNSAFDEFMNVAKRIEDGEFW